MRHLELISENENVVVTMSIEEHLQLRNILDSVLYAVQKGEANENGTWISTFLTNTELKGLKEIFQSFQEVWEFKNLCKEMKLEK